MIVGNGRIPTPISIYLIPDVKQEVIRVILSEWFKGYSSKKFIKIYGI
jgi:hypothetical protein